MRLNSPEDFFNAYLLMATDFEHTSSVPTRETANQHLWDFIVARRPDIAEKIAGTPADPRKTEAPLAGPTVEAIKTLW